MGTINLILSNGYGVYLQRPIYSFTSNFKGGLNEYKINMRDILNITSEFTFKPNEGLNVLSLSRRGYEILDYVNEFYTYLATILIELDPL